MVEGETPEVCDLQESEQNLTDTDADHPNRTSATRRLVDSSSTRRFALL